jgi:hypothetical protein
MMLARYGSLRAPVATRLRSGLRLVYTRIDMLVADSIFKHNKHLISGQDSDATDPCFQIRQ